MRPLIQLEAESRIRLRSSWRSSGGRFEQADWASIGWAEGAAAIAFG